MKALDKKYAAMFLDWLRDNDHIITERDIERMYDAELDEYPVSIGSLEYSGSHVLQNVDPVAYRCGFLDFVDSMSLDQLCDYGLDSDDYAESLDSLWEEIKNMDELDNFVYDGQTYSFRMKPAPAPVTYKLPCSITGLDAEVDNCDPPAIVVVVEPGDPMSPGCLDRYLTTDGQLIDCSIDSVDFAHWFDLDELEELEENE